eukprot:g23458.t1
MEQSHFRSYTGTNPHLFLRYINDCIGTASSSHEELEQFIHFTNAFHPNIKFTWAISDTSLSFLDLSVSIPGDHLETAIYFKPTDSQSYLAYTSSHPPSCKKAIPYSQFLCLHRICSQDDAFLSQTSQMSSYFKDLNFSPSVVQNALDHISCAPIKAFHIRQMFTCTSTNVAYCICCSRRGLLYIGEIMWRLGDCFVEHLRSVHDKRQHLPVTKHFNSPFHSLDDMSILDLLQCHN